MKICIDARWIGARIAGIGRYTVYLMRYLAELDGENHYLVLFQDPAVRDAVCAELGLPRARWEVRTLPYGVFSPRGQLSLPAFLRREGVDLFHSTNFMAPLRRFGGRLVLTVHDIIPLKHPEFAPRSKKSRLFPVYRALMRRLVSIADLIIADSEHSRRDLVGFLGVPPAKVQRIYLGVDPKYRPLPPAAREEARRTLGVRGRLALFAGRADPYKNLMTLVKAAEILNRKGSARATGQARSACPAGDPLRERCVVVVAGAEDPRYPEVSRYVEAAGIARDVVFAGSLGEEELIRLYNAADVLVLPSLYEGFGLPPLEAMACGTPVICADRTSLPEVVGDAGILVDPMDAGALAAAMKRLFTDDALRRRMVAAGLERAKLFPWRRTAEETLDVYGHVMTNDKNMTNE
jgi:glycosyltransferase involved in cell wall biosynthesis